MNTSYLMEKKNFDLLYKVLRLISLNHVVFIFPFLFVDFNLEATVIKTVEIRALKQLFTPCFLLIRQQNFPKNN